MKYIFLLISLFAINVFGFNIKQNLDLAESKINDQPDSALILLEEIYPAYPEMSKKQKALFGFLYFQACDKNELDYPPVEIIDFSISHYKKRFQNYSTAYCYLYKSRMFEPEFYLKQHIEYLLESLKHAERSFKKDKSLLGKIYFDLGYVSSMQMEMDKAEEYYLKAEGYFKQVNETNNWANCMIGLADIYRKKGNLDKATEYYYQIIDLPDIDSIAKGTVLFDVGRVHYYNKNLDSALYYIKNSLKYPAFEINLSLRYSILSNIYFRKQQSDSALHYGYIAKEIPTTFYIKRDIYNTLSNIHQNIGSNKDTLKHYLNEYKNYTDSIEIQKSNSNVIHMTEKAESDKQLSKANLFIYLLIAGLIIGFIVAAILIYRNYQNVKDTQITADDYKQQLILKQEQARKDLMAEIEETKAGLKEKRSDLKTPKEKEELDRSVFEKVMFIDKEDEFYRLMNELLNSLPDKLLSQYPDLKYRDIQYCCLQMLEISNAELCIIFRYTPNSVYKLKQRIIPKMNFNSTKDLDNLLDDLVKID